MNAGRHPTSYADLVIDRFRSWPLRECRADWPPGRALALHGLQLVHLHRGDVAEVLLSRQLIGRIATALITSGRVDVRCDTGWVRVRLDTDSDLFLLESLVSLAIQANDPGSVSVRRTAETCPHARRESPEAGAVRRVESPLPPRAPGKSGPPCGHETRQSRRTQRAP